VSKVNNPSHYKISHQMAETIWKSLHESGEKEIAKEFSKLMIEQGCQEIEVQDMSLIFAFWKDYMEEHNLLFLSPGKKDLH
tara:strand:- start:346 stop:588 length:243 start_codon:yes stop_codon:yes gene_type:complete